MTSVSMLAALLLTLLPAVPAQAQTPHHAGLVVVHGDGSVMSRCVEFDGESISGYELLERSGLELRMEVSGMGPTICAIDQEGCAGGEHCFCRCLSSPCEYWSYWRQNEDGWAYSNIGAGNTKVTDGVVEAWVWGKGDMQKGTAQQPPDLSLDAICQPQSATVETVATVATAATIASVTAPGGPITENASESASKNAAESAAAGSAAPGRLGESLGLLLVIGAPLLAAAGWWVARQSRKAPAEEHHEP